MPHTGQFTAAVAVLFDRPVALDDLAGALSDYDIVGRQDDADPAAWPHAGPSLLVAHRPDEGGHILVDAVDRPWPDGMGDPNETQQVFAAMGAGFFGPFVYPGGLNRAAQQCWAWPGGKDVPANQQAFVRLRCTYLIGAGEDAKPFPDGYDPAEELRILLGAAAAVLRAPGAIALFNPNGEVLRDIDAVSDDLDYADDAGTPPLELVSNVRAFPAADGWLLMDTVGNAQFSRPGGPDVPDVEACFPKGAFEPPAVDEFLRNVTLYLLDGAAGFADGDTIDGPGEKPWVARPRAAGVMNPPRPTVRFFPADAADVPPILLAEMQAAPE
jgi:hypothetical protein